MQNTRNPWIHIYDCLPPELLRQIAPAANEGRFHSDGFPAGLSLGVEPVEQRAERFTQGVPRVLRFPACQVADGGLATPANSGNLRLTPAVFLYLGDDRFPIHAAIISAYRFKSKRESDERYLYPIGYAIRIR